jgi:cysteine synthase A
LTNIKPSSRGSTNLLETKSKEEKDLEGGTQIEGIGPGRVYYGIGKAKIDGVFAGHDQFAMEMCHYLLKNEGLFLGGSAGLNVVGACTFDSFSLAYWVVWMAAKLGPGHTIATILADGGAGYISKIYNEEWLKEKNLQITRTTAQELLASYDDSKVKVELK